MVTPKIRLWHQKGDITISLKPPKISKRLFKSELVRGHLLTVIKLQTVVTDH